MTFEEIRDMVNSTITENKARQITGKALNLALTETLTAIEDFLDNIEIPQPKNTEIVYYNETITAEQQAANAAVYAKCLAALEAGEALPPIAIDLTDMMGASLESTDGLKAQQVAILVYIVTGAVAEAVGQSGMMIYSAGLQEISFMMQEDGSFASTSSLNL